VSASYFVQAEDGIRDRNVTGVQTCALPIYRLLHDGADGVIEEVDDSLDRLPLLDELHQLVPRLLQPRLQVLVPNLGAELLPGVRSEERRVGKEGRNRKWADDGNAREETIGR